MSKRTYRAKNVNDIDWGQMKIILKSSRCLLAIDIAKEEQFGYLTDFEQSHNQLFKWKHPQQTSVLIDALLDLGVDMQVAMESTGTYGDALRYQFVRSGFRVYQVSAKRVHDAKEIYDGVASLHDAKAACLIARLHLEGLSRLWVESSDLQRQFDALRQQYEIHTSQYRRNLNRLEALLQRYWPELTRLLDLDSVSLETLIREYTTPLAVSLAPEQVKVRLRQASIGNLGSEKICAIISSAGQTQGQPSIEAEQDYLRSLGEELKHSRLQAKQVKVRIEKLIEQQDSLEFASAVIGKVSVAMLLSERLDPRDYSTPASYIKSMGLNLKENSSGQYKGQLHITKRGSSLARRYLYYAALRLIKSDAIVRAWYLAKKKRDGDVSLKGIIAVMRKLAKALWYVFRGQQFNAEKLFTIKA